MVSKELSKSLNLWLQSNLNGDRHLIFLRPNSLQSNPLSPPPSLIHLLSRLAALFRFLNSKLCSIAYLFSSACNFDILIKEYCACIVSELVLKIRHMTYE